VVGFAFAVLTIAPFMHDLRRSGERAGRAAERLDQLQFTLGVDGLRAK